MEKREQLLKEFQDLLDKKEQGIFVLLTLKNDNIISRSATSNLTRNEAWEVFKTFAENLYNRLQALPPETNEVDLT